MQEPEHHDPSTDATGLTLDAQADAAAAREPDPTPTPRQRPDAQEEPTSGDQPAVREVMLTVQQVVDATGVTLGRVKTLCEEGRIPGVDNVGSGSRAHWRVPLSQLERIETIATERFAKKPAAEPGPQKASVGRIVRVMPKEGSELAGPFAAIITQVHDDEVCDLTVFAPGMAPAPVPTMPFDAEGTGAPRTWFWPPR